MRALDLALKDLLQLVRDWRSALFLLALPVLLTLLLGFAFGGFGGGAQDPRLPTGYVNLDPEGSLSEPLLGLLEGSRAVRIEPQDETDPDRLDRKVRDGDLAAIVVVPAGYAQALLGGDPLPLSVTADGSTAGVTAQNELGVAAGRLAGCVRAAHLALQAHELSMGSSEAAGALSGAERQAFLVGAVERAAALWRAPPLEVEVRQSGQDRQETEGIRQTGFSHTSPAMMVQFSIAGLIGSATLLLNERKTRALRRMLTTPISRTEVIAGHYLAMALIIFAQLVVLVAFGQFALRVPYLREPVAVLLLVIASSLWTAALGLLIGTLAQNDDQVTIFSLVPMFVLAGMGGAWVPLEFTGKTFQAIGHALPTAWAMDGFENIVIRGLGVQSALLPCAIMLAYAAVLFALAAWRFRFE